MTFYLRANDIYRDYGYPSGSMVAFCADCDEEILTEDPMFYDADGDIDSDGHLYDCSTYLCKPCGLLRGYESK